MTDILSELNYLLGMPVAKAKLKVKPEDFKVIEELGFPLSGSGEHLMLRIRKRGETTSFVANELAKACGVKSKDIGWAGLKDRHAVTEQWLSVYLPKIDSPDLSAFLAQYPQIEVLEQTRHHKKLKPGDLIGNSFDITLTEVTDMAAMIERLEMVKTRGVPNYYGSQRFGRNGNNVSEARRWGRENVRSRNQGQRSLFLSAARSWIYNQIVSERIAQGCFDHFILGDIAEQDGELIHVDESNITALNEKLAVGEVAITAALAGDNALPLSSAALELEQRHLDNEPDMMKLIQNNRMRHARRAINILPSNMTWKTKDNTVIVSFSLPAGSFATSIIREVAKEIPHERVFD